MSDEEEFAFEDDIGGNITDDIDDILLSDDGQREELISTGLIGANGMQKQMRVTIRDAREPGLMTSFSMMEHEEPEKAMKMLWKKCLVKPEALWEDDKFKRLPSTFRDSLTIRILRLNGYDAFFERLGLVTDRPEVMKALTASYKSSPRSTVSPPARYGGSSTSPTSSPPTS